MAWSGAIAWNLITWYFGLPSSSSHALIGGMVGAVFVAEGPDSVFFLEGIVGKVMVPAIVAPVLAFVVGGLAIVALYRIVARLRPAPVVGGFRLGQVISGGLLALAHGTNDAQKTMGVITLALVANGTIAEDNFHVPDWVVIASATAIALGTYVGGWRIIKTMGSRIHKMDAAQGFAAQGSGATVILAASHVGFPLSTTQTISGAVIGSGAAKRLSAVRWGVAGNIVVAWILTLPGAALIGGLTYLVTRAVRDRGRRSDRGLGRDPGRRCDAVRALARRRAAGCGARSRELDVVIATVVDWDALLQVIWVSLLAGVAVPAAWGFAIVGASRSVERGREGRPGEAVLFVVVGIAGFATVIGAVVFGILVLTGD